MTEAGHVSIDDNIMNTLRANPGLHLTDEFGEVKIAGAFFPLTEARAAITHLEAQGLIARVRDFARSRAYALTDAGRRAPVAPTAPQGAPLTGAQARIVTHAQQTGAAFTVIDLSAAGLQFSATDLDALLNAGLIERAALQAGGIHIMFSLTPAGKNYAVAPTPDAPIPAQALIDRLNALRASWHASADEANGKAFSEQSEEAARRLAYSADLLRACADDLQRVIEGGDA